DLAADHLELSLTEPVTEVAEMTDTKVVDFDGIDEVLSPFRALLGVVVGLRTGHGDRLDLELAGARHEVGVPRQSLQAEVGRVFVGEDDDLDFEPHRGETELRLVGVDHHGRRATPETDGVQAELGAFDRPAAYTRSGAATPINPRALPIVVRRAREYRS